MLLADAPLALSPPDMSALPVVELLPEAPIDPDEDSDADPDAAVFSRGWPVALSRQCVAGEILALEPALGEEELLED